MRNLSPALGAAALIVCAAVGTSACEKSGTLVITSMPTDKVDLFLDGELIASKTPVTKSDVRLGAHTLLARSHGFEEKAYRFDLAAGAPAIILVRLEALARETPEAPADPPAETPPGGRDDVTDR